jgi:hypothetical protein
MCANMHESHSTVVVHMLRLAAATRADSPILQRSEQYALCAKPQLLSSCTTNTQDSWRYGFQPLPCSCNTTARSMPPSAPANGGGGGGGGRPKSDECVKVVVRIRPLSRKEVQDGHLA